MPRPKKEPRDLTTEEAIKKLFPKKVRETIKEKAREQEKPSIKKDRT
jgi:hypothetical protein